MTTFNGHLIFQFAILAGKPGLTKEDLKKHDAIQGIQPQLEQLDIDDDETQTEGTVKTYNTFATNYSNCSNASFNRSVMNWFLACTKVDLDILTRMRILQVPEPFPIDFTAAQGNASCAVSSNRSDKTEWWN